MIIKMFTDGQQLKRESGLKERKEYDKMIINNTMEVYHGT
jgi:hypothetical protein